MTTRSPDGRVHIAPMGIRNEAGRVVLAPFRPSTTLDNVLATGAATVNTTDDVRIFAGCLTGRHEWPTVACERVPCVRLVDPIAHRELKLVRVEEDATRPRLLFDTVFERTHRAFAGFNRAQAAVIEAAILVSRLGMLPDEKIDAELAYLVVAVEKTGGPAEREAWDWLTARIEQFRSSARREKI